jgi:hypothetical protein
MTEPEFESLPKTSRFAGTKSGLGDYHPSGFAGNLPAANLGCVVMIAAPLISPASDFHCVAFHFCRGGAFPHLLRQLLIF